MPGQTRYLYPDVTVVCGAPELEDADTLLNPRIIIEVLSDSTETFDRGRKFEAYQAIPSLTEYIVVAQDRVRVDQFIRGENASSWLLRPHGQGSVELATLGIQLPLASIYAGVLG